MSHVVGVLEPQALPETMDAIHGGSYIWKIPDFSRHAEKRLICSPIFQKGGELWHIAFYPSGTDRAHSGYMSLFLKHLGIANSHTGTIRVDPWAKFSMEILHPIEGNQINHQGHDFHCFCGSQSEWGWKNFAKIHQLYQDNSGLFIQDWLKIQLILVIRPTPRSFFREIEQFGNCQSQEPSITQPIEGHIERIEEDVDSCLISIRVLTNRILKERIGNGAIVGGLVPFEDCKTYCLFKQTSLNSFKELVCNDSDINDGFIRLWLCEKLPFNQIKILKNLAQESLRIEKISDLLSLFNACHPVLGDVNSIRSIDIFAESALQGIHELHPLNNEEDWIGFLKYFDPWNDQMYYAGTIPLRKHCSPEDIIRHARAQSGLPLNYHLRIFIERPIANALIHELQTNDHLEEVGLRPGSTLIVQPRVGNAGRIEDIGMNPNADYFLKKRILEELKQSFVSNDQIRDEPMLCYNPCVLCCTKPITSGFLHGDSLHKCACEECASMIHSVNGGLCPLCYQKVDFVVKKVV